ncbi:hypothetical protein CMI47_22095 [Candidatus Pacearchaeota archaeon]|nr:hypothetical protein [Candidatus Pacearchaeota archaeon]
MNNIMMTKTKKVKKVPKPTSVTLCMIVKNESHIIKECLESMIPYIDRYDITDTGSTDGTPELIKEFMDEYGVPGEVYLSDWKGFGDSAKNIGSRTEALNNAKEKADYAWMIDADDFMTGNFEYPSEMKEDAYSIRLGREDFVWWRNQIFRLESNWHYVGILHEYAACEKENPIVGRMGGEYKVTARTLGARNVGISTQEKYKRDAEELEDALYNENSPNYDPNNSRYVFYLAQSYFDSQQYEKSLESYGKRAEMGGWEEEVYYSLYRVAMITAVLDKPWEEIQQAFLDAYDSRPIRAEPLYQIARLYRQVHNKPRLGYIFAKMAMEIQYPQQDILFISDEVYKYQLLDEIGATAWAAGKPHVGYAACKRLIEENLVPDNERERISNNLKQYEQLLSQMHSEQAQNHVAQRMAEKTAQEKEKKKNKEKRKNRTKGSTKTSSPKNRKKRKNK